MYPFTILNFFTNTIKRKDKEKITIEQPNTQANKKSKSDDNQKR